MTISKPKLRVSWEVNIGKMTSCGSTKEEVLERCKDSINKQEEKGLSWELRQIWTTPRTKPYPNVLIIGSGKTVRRTHENWIEKFNNINLRPGTRRGHLHWVDSSGSRSVYYYSDKLINCDYEDAIDLPLDIYKELAIFLKKHKVSVHLFLLQEDPGLGIMLPQDNPENGFSYREVNPLEKVINTQGDN